jgi:hypothetical protein
VKKTLRILLCCVGLLLLVSLILGPLTVSLKHASYADPGVSESIKLDIVTGALRTYAEHHNGQYPQMNLPAAVDGINAKAICVVTDLPGPSEDGNYPDPVRERDYAFFYFPMDAPQNANLPLSAPDSDVIGINEKVLTASIHTFYLTSRSELTLEPYLASGTRLRRWVEFYSGRGWMVDESEFQKFLNQTPGALLNANDKPASAQKEK